MVKICANTYPIENENKYKNYFNLFPFELSPFQKWSIESIVSGNHVLTCAHTGSGKTLPAEFAISYFCNLKWKETTDTDVHKPSKVIYCSPIKALSNQKYYDFKNNANFNDISIGLITGDIKTNMEADVLIMTTEILLNKLYKYNTNNNCSKEIKTYLDFNLDINDIACVIFDEIHYINDKDRGHVWEELLIMLPKTIQLIMLSATIENPTNFATWIESLAFNKNIKEIKEYKETEEKEYKEIYLTTTQKRIVPLIHYSFITSTTALNKLYKKDKEITHKIDTNINKLHIIKTQDGVFQDKTVSNIKNILTLYDKKNYTPSRNHVLNQVCKVMLEENMFPAICFVYSRRLAEEMADKLETVLLEDDSKVRYIIHEECNQILRRNLVNWHEYVDLKEYRFLLSLLEKGVAIHHAGMLSVFREIVEIMFSKGYIKMLFATETFSVGINMPTKTVLFTSLSKYDGSFERMLAPHEYNQQSGRAGRRGKDTIGHVIHLTNLWETNKYSNTELNMMMIGSPQKLVSKFNISYKILLNFIGGDNNMNKIQLDDVINHVKSSLSENDINNELKEIEKKMLEIKSIIDDYMKNINHEDEQIIIYKKYYDLETLLADTSIKQNKTTYKKEKDILKSISDMNAYKEYKKIMLLKSEYNNYMDKYCNLENYTKNKVSIIIDTLLKYDYIKTSDDEYYLTSKGYMTTLIHEINSLYFIEWFMKENNVHKMVNWGVIDIIKFLSIFVSLSIESYPSSDKNVIEFEKTCLELDNEFLKKNMFIENVEINVNLMEYMEAWCNAINKEDCQYIIELLERNKIAIGEFVKAILKMSNIAKELESLSEYIGDYILLEKMKKIPDLILKHVCTATTLYL